NSSIPRDNSCCIASASNPLPTENTFTRVSSHQGVSSSARPAHRLSTGSPCQYTQKAAPSSPRNLKLSAKACRTPAHWGGQSPSIFTAITKPLSAISKDQTQNVPIIINPATQ